MEDVYIVGVGMTNFGKFPNETIKTLSKTAITRACEHAGIRQQDIQIASVGNAFQGIATGIYNLGFAIELLVEQPG